VWPIAVANLPKARLTEIKEIVRYQPNTVIMYAPDNDDVGQSLRYLGYGKNSRN
jgi:hypothetical protein